MNIRLRVKELWSRRRKKKADARERNSRPENPVTGMRVDATSCMRCGACASVCPSNSIQISDAMAAILHPCNNCGLCAKACPVGAIAHAQGI